MLRYIIPMLALGGMTIVAVAPRDRADAQSGQALAYAEHACLEYKVTPGTTTFENCVVRAAKAFDQGQPDLAYGHARTARDSREMRDSREACASKGAAQDTSDYSECMAEQAELHNKR